MVGEQGDVLLTSRLRPLTQRSTWWSSNTGEHSYKVEDTPTSARHSCQSRVLGTVPGEVKVIGIHQAPTRWVSRLMTRWPYGARLWDQILWYASHSWKSTSSCAALTPYLCKGEGLSFLEFARCSPICLIVEKELTVVDNYQTKHQSNVREASGAIANLTFSIF